ncbi:MAG: hypothetical protein EXS67_03705 [Candidatus Margulisbacteria bacterium]|nr:hypothetical protein [Candidatus Margulisiibacteriota bacterium]
MKKEAGKLRLGRIILFVFLIPVLLILGLRQFTHTPKETKLHLGSIEKIGEGLKMIVTPVTLLPDHKVLFTVRMESYEYPELLESNLKDTALLIDETETPFIPDSWKVVAKDSGSITGELVLPYSEISTKWVLSFDDMEDTSFEWTLPKNGR